MRNGNWNTHHFRDRASCGSIESMRNGNPRTSSSLACGSPVQSNLWGMETSSCKLEIAKRRGVQSNLWGMETTVICDEKKLAEAFNRIYEEWKPVNSNGTVNVTPSSIESMRNGNFTWFPSLLRGRSVQSNLWGMETCRFREIVFDVSKFNRIYEEWKPDSYTPQKYALLGSIESMRNGNPCTVINAPAETPFNRIYEEWKPSSSNFDFAR